VHVQRLGVADVVRAPHPVDQLATGEHPADIAQQILEQVELLERQRHVFAVHRHDVPLDVHPHRPGRKNQRVSSPSAPGSPPRRSTARTRAMSSRPSRAW